MSRLRKETTLFRDTAASQVDRTLGFVYQSALDPGRSPDLLRSLAGLFRSHFADMYSREHDGSRAAGTVLGLDRADYEDGMIKTWARRNPWTRSAPVVSAGAVRATWQFLSGAELRRSEMFADYLDPRSLHEGMRLEVWSDRSGIEDISLLRSFDAGPFTAEELALGRMLLPHLQRAAEMRRRLQWAEVTAEACLGTLETLHHGVVLLDGSARPVFCNRAAHALLADGDAVSFHGNDWVVADPSADPSFRATLRQATAERGSARAGASHLPSRSGRAATTVLGLPLQWNGAWQQPGQPVAILCFSGGRQVVSAGALSPFAAAFGLTPSETRLAAMLLSGHTLMEIARAQNRSLATIRTHLSRTMAKTATTRQGELLHRLAEFPLAIEP